MKELNDINSNNVMSSRLLQSKSYLKILGIPYLWEDTNLSVTPNIIERVIKSTHIFDDTILASYVKIAESRLGFFLFSYSHFHFLLIYFHFSILELRVRVSDNITQSHDT